MRHGCFFYQNDTSGLRTLQPRRSSTLLGVSKIFQTKVGLTVTHAINDATAEGKLKAEGGVRTSCGGEPPVMSGDPDLAHSPHSSSSSSSTGSSSSRETAKLAHVVLPALLATLFEKTRDGHSRIRRGGACAPTKSWHHHHQG
eukprot:TRINITY_DN150_c0_g1_i1.p2 TRINITY_DN150_c0_g1~~TRINITY_DN150_c0_g1_i1.p2  ORF type:complete len:143 (-),score=8.48 TRINITY_DN150_c0_g1_i1:239-667(-)